MNKTCLTQSLTHSMHLINCNHYSFSQRLLFYEKHTQLLQIIYFHQFSSVQSLIRVWLFAIPQIAACQASLSITISQSLFKLMSITLVMLSNHLILCHPFSSCLQSFPAPGSFPMSQFFASGGQSIGASGSESVLWMNIQGWFLLGLTGWISLQSKGLSRVFSSTTI